MNHQDIISQKLEFLNGNSASDLSEEAKNLVKKDADLAKEIKFIEEVWQSPNLSTEYKPSAQMQARFYQMLSHAQSTETQQPISTKKVREESILSRLGLFKPAFQMLLLLVVFSGGWLLNGGQGTKEINDTIAMEKRIDTLNVMVALSMMKQDSAAERLVGVDYAKGANLNNAQLTGSLLSLLNGDRSSAVRLSVVDVLANQAEQNQIKEKLIDSLSKQKNVLVQMALVELLQNSMPLNNEQLDLIFSNEELDVEVIKFLNKKDSQIKSSI